MMPFRNLLLLSISLIALIFSFTSYSKITPSAAPLLDKNEKNLCHCNCDESAALFHAPITNDNLVNWSTTAALSVFSYGFGNYTTSLENSSRYFTPQGWAQFKRALFKSGNLETV